MISRTFLVPDDGCCPTTGCGCRFLLPVGVLDILALIRGALHQMPGTGSDASETGSVINGGGRASLTNGAVSAAADEPDAVVMAPGQPRGSAEEERAQAAV